MTKKLISIFVAVMMVLSIIPAAAFASDGNRGAERPNTTASLMPVESTRDAADLNEALNVPGGELVFVSEGTYPWVVDGDAAKSGNAGVSSSTSAVSTTATAVEGDIVQFDFKAWGEGSSTYWDKCEFAIDGTVVLSKGAYANVEWEAFTTELTPGEHTLTWSYTKDSSVNPNGDYFAVDNVYVGQPAAAESINVDPVSVPEDRRATVSYEVLPASAFDKSVTFSIADTSIATVDANGVVTGVAEGTTTITVTSAAVPTVSGTATVTVTEALPTVNLEGFATYDMASSGLTGNWIGFADFDPSVAAVLGAMEGNAWAGAFAGGSVYGYIYNEGNGNNFYIMDPETYSVSFPGTNADSVGGVIGMAYNHANQTMYGIGVGNREIVTVDLATGVPTVVAAISNSNLINVLAIDLEGNAYTMTSAGDLMALDLTNGSTTLIGSTGVSASYVQSITYDFTTEKIYWAQIFSASSHGLYVVDPQTAAVESLGLIGPGGAEVTSLYIKNDLPIDPIEMPDVTVTFVDGLDNAVLGTQTVEAGTVLDESTFPTAPEHAGFEFTGWDYDGAAVYADTTIKAMYHDPNATIWDFETDPVEQGFTFLDQDGDGNNWYWHVNTGSGNLTAHSGDGVAASESYSNDANMALTPDNWMVTPEFNGSFISFWMQAQQASYSDDYVGVYVSTDGGETWSDELFGQMTPDEYQQFTIDLSAYAGQTINVAFRHYNCTDMFIALIDDIEVSGGGETPEPPVTPEPGEPGEEVLVAGYYFEDGNDGWTFNGTEDTNWIHSSENLGGYDYTSLAHEGSGFIMSYSFVDYVGSYQADNWAISPAVTLPTGSARVSFYATNANADYPEAFDVYIGTSADTSAMTLLQANVSPSNGSQGPWTHYEFDLSDYAGQTIYLAFYDHCYDMYEIWIDQVEFFGEAGGSEPTDPIVIDTVEIIGLDAPVLGGTPDMDVTVPEDAHYTLTKVEWHVMNKEIIDGDYVITPGLYYVVFEFEPEEGYEFGAVSDTTMIINGGSDLVGLPIFCYSFPELFHMESTEFIVEEPAPAPTLDEALNVEGGELHFESEGDYPWIVVNDEESGRLYAMSGNAGVHSSDSILTTTITANAGDVVSFEFQAWGEGTGTFWDYCEFAIDGERVGYWGAYQNEEWELFTSEPMTAGEHTLTWKFHKDSSVSKPGDCFMVDNVEITEGELPPTGILGDVDLNGEVTTADALMALRYVMGLIELNEDQLAQADVTGEGEVTVADPLLILRHAMGLIETFPAEEA